MPEKPEPKQCQAEMSEWAALKEWNLRENSLGSLAKTNPSWERG